MTIDELRARKRDLQARLKYERELQARGEGDNLALFMVREKLLDVNDQLRALTAGRRKRGGLTKAANYTKDRQQYLNWRREDTALDDEIDEGRARMRRAAVNGLDDLPPRQREMLEMYLAGKNIPAIAAELGLNRSTVSRNICRAKKNLRAETERAMAAHRLLAAGAPTVDLRDLAAAKTVFLALTPKQTAYFYLYYSECMTFREIEELTGTDHAAIVRTVRRALRNLDKLLGGQEAVLEHPEALDELAFQAYCQMEDHPELLPERAPVPVPYHPPAGRKPGGGPPPMASLSILVRRERRSTAEPPGKLLSALLEGQGVKGGPQLLRWLEGVFSALLGRLGKRGGRERATM